MSGELTITKTTSNFNLVQPDICIGEAITNSNRAVSPTSVSNQDASFNEEAKIMTSVPFSTEVKIECDNYPEFIRGRKVQFISDYWPDVPKIKGRANVVRKLLPELTSTPENLEKNFTHTITNISKKLCYSMDIVCTLDLSRLTPEQQFSLGRDYQFLIDTDKRKWLFTTINKLTIEEIMDESIKLRRRLEEGFFKLIKKKKRPNKIRDIFNCVTIIECKGDKCRIHFLDGTNTHCESCYDKLTLDIVAENPYPKKVDNYSRQTIHCNGRKCRLNDDTYYCASCYGSDEEWDNFYILSQI